MADQSKFALPQDIEHYLRTLSKLYKRDGATERLEVVVNGGVRVEEEYEYDNWNGGTYGHALFLSLPEATYLGLIEDIDSLQRAIQTDLNKLHNIPDEHVCRVFIEMEKREDDHGWRQESGLLIRTPKRHVGTKALSRIWNDGGYRVFLSHKSEVKKKTGDLSAALRPFGISAFVAHANIEPTKHWQDEIENALASADAFVALLTEKFHESKWTDQEVGYALGRGIPLICVKLGLDPYGFIGKFQALSCDWEEAPIEVVKLLIKHPSMIDAYTAALSKCNSFDEGIVLAQALDGIEAMTVAQADAMVQVFNQSPDIRGCWAFNGTYPYRYGDGLPPLLSRLTGKEYIRTKAGDIERKGK